MKKTDEKIRHMEKYESYPVARKVLTQETTFKGEVGHFYNLSWKMEIGVPKVGIIEIFNLKKEDPKKRGKYPAILINILGGFAATWKPFHVDALKYDSVRKNCQKWNNNVAKAKSTNFFLVARSFIGTSYPKESDTENECVSEYLRC